MTNGYYKWSYDPRDGNLEIWAVSGPQSYARPQHGDQKGSDGYAYCSQGRLTIDGDEARGIIYLSRPFMAPKTTSIEELQATAKEMLEEEVEREIKWQAEH